MKEMKEQRADTIVCQGYQFEFPKGQIAVGESFDVCVDPRRILRL
jgi:hypothetical protein